MLAVSGVLGISLSGSGLALADSGDSNDTGSCTSTFESGVYENGRCIVEDCCADGDCADFEDYLALDDNTTLAWDCAPGSDMAHVYYSKWTELSHFVWFDESGRPIGSTHLGWFCCEGHEAEHLTCGLPPGTCLAPTLTSLPDDPPPTHSTECEGSHACSSCSIGVRAGVLWPFAFLALLRRWR